jgi:hypothetical protein
MFLSEHIVVLEQVRSNINIEADLFKSFMQSIKDKGIINSGKKGSRGRGFEGPRGRKQRRERGAKSATHGVEGPNHSITHQHPAYRLCFIMSIHLFAFPHFPISVTS